MYRWVQRCKGSVFNWTRNERLRVYRSLRPLQATSSKLLAYCELRPIQPLIHCWTGNEKELNVGYRAVSRSRDSQISASGGFEKHSLFCISSGVGGIRRCPLASHTQFLMKNLQAQCIDAGAAPRFWKWGDKFCSLRSQKIFWPPLFGQWGAKYCLVSLIRMFASLTLV